MAPPRRSCPAAAQQAAVEDGGADPAQPEHELIDPELEELDPYQVEHSKLALHSLSGHRCTCPACATAVQRRDFAEAGSHPHSEHICQVTPGAHQFSIYNLH